MKIVLPELSLVVLIGASGSGKSTFAKKHFRWSEVLSSDFCRGLVSDDENDQAATNAAFEVLHFIATKRLKAGLLTVVDATNVQPEARKPLVVLAREFHCLPVAIVFDLPEDICQQRNVNRSDRSFGKHVVRQQTQQLRKSLRALEREGFRHVHILSSVEEIEEVEIERQPLWNNRKNDYGPFDIIGDVHGCFDELTELLAKLGYREQDGCHRHPEGRKAIFLGDLVDRGPRVPDVVMLVTKMVECGQALCVPGNHDSKFVKAVRGSNVKVAHGLAESLSQFEERERLIPGGTVAAADFLHGLVSHYVLDGGNLVVAHAGLKEEMQGRGSGKVREFCLYGETTGETDEIGLPVRYNWAADYRGKAKVVYGHTVVDRPDWLNGTINIDTGCVFGGRLTALRYPEMELVSVDSHQVYTVPVRPLVNEPAERSPQQTFDDVLEIEDVIGKRFITTRLRPRITIREENSAAAMEAISRFAVAPQWLIYLPPTMSPCATSKLPEHLEYPTEAFEYFRDHGVSEVICQEKHMGSRAVVILGREPDAIRRRFGVNPAENAGLGIIHTRTGRRFFDDNSLEQALLAHLTEVLSMAGFWNEYQTDWVCLDCELMPWSAKAEALLRAQYAAVGVSAETSLGAATDLLAGQSKPEFQQLSRDWQDRLDCIAKYRVAYRRYCWPVHSFKDLKIAPFFLLASEGRTYFNQTHSWHLERLDRMAAADPHKVVSSTSSLLVNVRDEASQEAGIQWWLNLIGSGSEGMVVKPLDPLGQPGRSLVQPGIKCRGREYLRIIYGPEYTRENNLNRLRERGLGRKRALALREFALGIEAVERFVNREPLRRVHECVLGVLAMESEPVDPRL